MKSYLFLALLFTIGVASAQKNYYQQIEQSKKVIDSIVKTEKKALSIELKTLDEQFAQSRYRAYPPYLLTRALHN